MKLYWLSTYLDRRLLCLDEISIILICWNLLIITWTVLSFNIDWKGVWAPRNLYENENRIRQTAVKLLRYKCHKLHTRVLYRILWSVSSTLDYNGLFLEISGKGLPDVRLEAVSAKLGQETCWWVGVHKGCYGRSCSNSF